MPDAPPPEAPKEEDLTWDKAFEPYAMELGFFLREWNDEELAIFDVLTQPDPVLSDEETREVKKIAKELLAKLKAGLLVIEWRTKQQARAAVHRAIRQAFGALPAAYSSDIKRVNVNRTYAHVYDSYSGVGQSVYETRASV